MRGIENHLRSPILIMDGPSAQRQLAASLAAWLRDVFRSRAFKAATAAGLIVALYCATDWRSAARTLAGLDPGWLAASMVLFVPQTLVSAFRWKWLVRSQCGIGIQEAVRQTLASSALNLVAPSKLGDLSKAAMLPLNDRANKAKACGLVIVEKLADVAALAFFTVLGAWGWQYALLAGATMALLIAVELKVRQESSRLALVTASIPSLAIFSLVLWVLHLTQIDWFLRAAGVVVPWHVSLARLPLAIFAGLLPISMCGVGIRDTALVWLFADVASAGTMAAVGGLTALRYLIPGGIGVICLHRGRRGID